jgi:hypothetical protein
VLLFLPKQLRDVKPQAVDFYLCGLKPNAEEKVWALSVSKLVKSWVEDVKTRKRDECFLSGEVKIIIYAKCFKS